MVKNELCATCEKNPHGKTCCSWFQDIPSQSQLELLIGREGSTVPATSKILIMKRHHLLVQILAKF